MNFNTIRVILQRELRSLFLSPIAYMLAFFYLLITGFTFMISVQALNESPRDFTVMEIFFQNFFIWIAQLFIMPVLTMRSFSEEYRLGTFEGLMTAPVRDWEVVLAKYLAVLAFYVALWAPTVLYQFIFQIVAVTPTPLSNGPVWCNYAMVLMMGMLYAALGLMISSLTHNQIVAVLVSLVSTCMVFFLGLLNFFFNPPGAIRDVLSYISVFEHMEQFGQGIVNTRALVFYASASFMLLLVTQKIIESKRWRA